MSLCNQFSSFLIEKIRDTNIEGELSRQGRGWSRVGEDKGEWRVYEYYQNTLKMYNILKMFNKQCLDCQFPRSQSSYIVYRPPRTTNQKGGKHHPQWLVNSITRSKLSKKSFQKSSSMSLSGTVMEPNIRILWNSKEWIVLDKLLSINWGYQL